MYHLVTGTVTAADVGIAATSVTVTTATAGIDAADRTAAASAAGAGTTNGTAVVAAAASAGTANSAVVTTGIAAGIADEIREDDAVDIGRTGIAGHRISSKENIAEGVPSTTFYASAVKTDTATVRTGLRHIGPAFWLASGYQAAELRRSSQSPRP